MNLLIALVIIFPTIITADVLIKVESGDNDIHPHINGTNLVYKNWGGDVMMVCESYTSLSGKCSLMSDAEYYSIIVISMVCSILIPIPILICITCACMRCRNRSRKDYIVIE